MSCRLRLRPEAIVVVLILTALRGGLAYAGAETPAAVPAAAVSLQLVPLSGSAIALGRSDFERLPHRTVRVSYPEGPNHREVQAEFSGVPLRELLSLMSLPAGPALRGEALQLYLLAEGADGYRVVFALPDLDPGFMATTALVADRRDGKPLAAAEGPLRIVIPEEKRPARWVRQLVRITVRKAT